MPRKISPKLFSFPWQLGKSVWQAKNIIKKFKPTAVLGTGGYAAAPALAAAIIKKIPIIIHEPDSNPGLVNKVFAPYAKIISLGMEAAQAKFESLTKAKIIINGNPLAERFLKLPNRLEACNELGLNPDLPVVLVTGGSQGAQAINEAVYEMVSDMVQGPEKAKFQIVHQIGDKNWADMEAHLDSSIRNHPLYKAKKYFDNLAIPYAACDIAVCRSGAMTISELAVTGTPAIFIPYPFAAADHQAFNAHYIASKGAAKVIMQNDLSSSELHKAIIQLITDTNHLSMMQRQMHSLAKPQAATQLTEQLLQWS